MRQIRQRTLWWGSILAAFPLLVACQHGGAPTEATTSEQEINLVWRGARLVGERAAELPALLERAWPTIAQRWPGWEPDGWIIKGWATRIPCTGAINGVATGCRGTTTPRKRLIQVSWINGPDDVVAILQWEICNAARADLTRRLVDVGCGS